MAIEEAKAEAENRISEEVSKQSEHYEEQIGRLEEEIKGLLE